MQENLPVAVDEPGFSTGSDALVVVDYQRDFLAGGSLAVKGADQILPVLNSYLRQAARLGMPVFLTRDWHPPHHVSFIERGGPWPPHCVAGTRGAEFAEGLEVPSGSVVISTATDPDYEAYSGFEGTDLDDRLRALGLDRLVVGGVATDYCVLHTVKDALAKGYRVALLADAIRAVDVRPGDGARALAEMFDAGAQILEGAQLEGAVATT